MTVAVTKLWWILTKFCTQGFRKKILDKIASEPNNLIIINSLKKLVIFNNKLKNDKSWTAY